MDEHVNIEKRIGVDDDGVAAYQVGDGDQEIVEDALAKESLDEAAARTSVTTADLDGLPDGHGGDDGVEEQRCDLCKQSQE